VAAGAEVIDPRDSAAPETRQTFEAYPHIGKVLPAIGYGTAQLAALKATIDDSTANVIVSATPVDLAALIQLRKKVVRARYGFAEADGGGLSRLIEAFVARAFPGHGGR
jgi:predicted GTPase